MAGFERKRLPVRRRGRIHASELGQRCAQFQPRRGKIRREVSRKLKIIRSVFAASLVPIREREFKQGRGKIMLKLDGAQEVALGFGVLSALTRQRAVPI